jgi:integrase
MFLAAVAHGARAQEICNLRLSDVNFANQQIHIEAEGAYAEHPDPAQDQGQFPVR